MFALESQQQDSCPGSRIQKFSQGPDDCSIPSTNYRGLVPPSTRIERQRVERQPSWTFTERLDVGGPFPQALDWADVGIQTNLSVQPDIVVASSPTFSGFVAGYFISRRLKCPLVLDYRDEWSENPFQFVRKTAFGRAWEKRCLRHATKVIFTTESGCDVRGFRRLQIALMGFNQSSCRCIPFALIQWWLSKIHCRFQISAHAKIHVAFGWSISDWKK